MKAEKKEKKIRDKRAEQTQKLKSKIQNG